MKDEKSYINTSLGEGYLEISEGGGMAHGWGDDI